MKNYRKMAFVFTIISLFLMGAVVSAEEKKPSGTVTIESDITAPTKVYDYDESENTLIIKIILAKWDSIALKLEQYWRNTLPVPFGGVWI